MRAGDSVAEQIVVGKGVVTRARLARRTSREGLRLFDGATIGQKHCKA